MSQQLIMYCLIAAAVGYYVGGNQREKQIQEKNKDAPFKNDIKYAIAEAIRTGQLNRQATSTIPSTPH